MVKQAVKAAPAAAKGTKKGADGTKRKADKHSQMVAMELAQNDELQKKTEDDEMIGEITDLLREKPRRIKKVRRALRNGMFDGKYRDPSKWFNIQYKHMHRVPWKHCRDATLPKMCSELSQTQPFKDGVNEDTRLAQKLVIFGTGLTSKDAILSSNKDAFDERCVKRHAELGYPLKKLAEANRPIDFEVDGCWTMLPPVPEEADEAKHFYEEVRFNPSGKKYTIPDKFALRGSWPLESNWDYMAAHVRGGKDVSIMRDILGPEDRKHILERMLAGKASEPDPEGSDGEDTEEAEEDLAYGDREERGNGQAAEAAATPTKPASEPAADPESGAKPQGLRPKRSRPPIPGAQVVV